MEAFLRRRESWLAVTLIGVFFLLNLSIASRMPWGGWMDEVYYVDPGLNLATGKGWISSAQASEPDTEFFAAGGPLYPAGISVWAHIFGTSIESTRSYCYFLGAIAMTFLWLGAARFNLLTPGYRLLWIVFLSTETAMSWMERNERYDIWIFVGLSLAWFGGTLRSRWARFPVIFLGCYLAPFAGFIGASYTVLVSLFVAVLTKFRYGRESATAIAGAVCGVASVYLFYAAFGELHTFSGFVNGMTVAYQSRLYSIWKIFTYPRQDEAVGVMMVLLAILTIYHARKRLPNAAPWILLGWGMIVLLPCMMLARGVFVRMYMYMLLIPLSLALLQLAQTTLARNRYLALAVTWVLMLVCLGGLPKDLYTCAKEWKFRDPQHRRDFVREYVRPNDRVFTDFAFYFDLHDYAKYVMVGFYYPIMTPQEASRINVAILLNDGNRDPSETVAGLSKYGAGWKKIANFPTPEMLTLPHGKAVVRESYTLYRRDIPSP